MNCKHDIKDLIGMAGGIKCSRCGRLFRTFDELQADQEPAAQEEKPKKARKKKDA